MIEEKRSKNYHKPDIGVRARSVKSARVLLQKLHIREDGAILPKDTVTKQHKISEVKINKVEEVQVVTTIKNPELKKSTNTILNSENESTLQSTNSIETTNELQSSLTDKCHGVALSTKSYKFKKKIKHLQNVQLNKSLKTQSGNKFYLDNSVITDKKLSKEIKEHPALLANTTTIQKIENNAVSVRRKLFRKIKANDDKECLGNNNLEKNHLLTNPVQETSSANNNNRIDEIIQINTSSKSGCINVRNSSPNISTSITSQGISSTSVIQENNSNIEDNSIRNTISTRNKLRKITKANNTSTTNACPVEIYNEFTITQINKKQISVDKTIERIENNDSSNLIKTRSKIYKKNTDNSEKPVPKLTLKQISNKFSMSKTILNHKVKENDSEDTQDNKNNKKTTSTRSRLCNVKKIDNHDKSFIENDPTQSKQKDSILNVSEIQMNSRFPSAGKIGNNLNFTSDIMIENKTTRKNSSKKVKMNNDKKLKPREVIKSKRTDLLQNSPISNSSQVSLEETIEKSKVDSDASPNKEIVKNKIKTRSKILQKKKVDGDNNTDGNEVTQAEEHFASISSEIQCNSEFSICENVFNQIISLVDLNKTQDIFNKEKGMSTRSKTLDKKYTAYQDKPIIEHNLLQTKNVQPILSSVLIDDKKYLASRNSSGKCKVVNEFLNTTDNLQHIISVRNKLIAKAKVDDNKKLTVEKLSIDTITVQSKKNQNVPTSTDDQIRNKLSTDKKLLNISKQNSTRTPKKVDTNTISTRSRAEKEKKNNDKSFQNQIICVEQNHSTSDSQITKNSKQLLLNEILKDSLKFLANTPDTKENDLTIRKSHDKKENASQKESHMENKIEKVKQSQLTSKQTDVQVSSKLSLITSPIDSQEYLTDSTKAIEDIDNTILTSSKKMLEKDKIYDHENSNLDNNSSNRRHKTDSKKTSKNIDLKNIISIKSNLIKKSETENREEFITDNEAVHIKKHHPALNSSRLQSSNESTLDIINSQLIPHAVSVNINDSSNAITTRRGLTRKIKADVNSVSKMIPLVENQHCSSKLQTYKCTIQQSNINSGNETNNSKINKYQYVCSEKEIVIKLVRCDQDQLKNICLSERGTPKKKVLQGKRKGNRIPTVEEEIKAKKSKQIDPSNDNVDSQVSTVNQQLTVVNQQPLDTIENIEKLVIESQNNIDSSISDIYIIKNSENVSNICEATEKDKCIENVSHINTADNANYVTESPETSEKENQYDNEHIENGKKIIVHNPSDNCSVNEEEILEDKGEGIFSDTSEKETNTEIHVNNDVIIGDNISTTAIQNKESHSVIVRKMVEEVINDWAVVDDDKTDNICVNGNFSTPEVIQIEDNEDLDVIIDVHQMAVNTEKEKDSSHNLRTTFRENTELDNIDISNSPLIDSEKSANTIDNKTVENKECNNMHKESRQSNSTSEQTSEVSEAEDIDDSNFESIDESSCAEIFANENHNDQEDNVPQETITYYNSEDISIDNGAPTDNNTLNDIVMNLKDACDKITADLSAVDTSYANNEEPSNHHEPELLYISDDSNEMEENEVEVMILEPQIEIHETEPSPVEQQGLIISNQLQQVMQQGSPSISVIKASELRDEVLEPPVEYPIKPTGQRVVHPQRQMLSTTLLPASIINDKQCPSSIFTEDSIIQCPKCKCEFVGKTRLRHHWLTCADAMYLCCPFCITKVKQRRSLIHHLNTQHQNQITSADAIKVVDRVVKETREVAGGILRQGSSFALRDLLRNTLTIPVIELPAFIRVQCVVCNKMYDEIPATYKKTCDDCSSDLMTAICQLCRKQYMLSTKIAVHVQGNCIFSGRIKCRDCEFVSSSRYHLQEHIIRKHIYLAPEDYYTCRLGCGKSFRVQDALKKHERICIKEADLNCRFCDYKTKHRSAMKMHLQQHILHKKLTIDNDGTVQVCGLQDRSETEDDDRDLITEQQIRSVIRVHCSRCNRTLRLTSNRSSCEFCKLSFTFSCSRCPNLGRLESLHAARLHVIRSHSAKIHECPHCIQKFSYVYDLTRHISRCKAKKFRCEHCNYRANEEHKIRQHKRRVHFSIINESPFCKKCGKWFNRGDSLKRHEKMHCGVKPGLSCEHCQFKTKTKFSLLRHIQSQHAYIYENFSFVCDRCNKFYTNMFAYEEHVKNCHALYKN
ncbi:protein PFC0760c-like isoform X2 [Phymastichus coffea]|uniref:protein PFC0760c-like isoform X2 n=1 Tax=Phymastichus coffea TaxID=108790 RepID=UPI00273CD312|nr:protein PFC0760c-like isoform X2 [Phymastichus coffea]